MSGEIVPATPYVAVPASDTFLLFVGPDEGYYANDGWRPGGGWHHFQQAYSDLAAACERGRKMLREHGTMDWWHVVDIRSTIVAEGRGDDVADADMELVVRAVPLPGRRPL